MTDVWVRRIGERVTFEAKSPRATAYMRWNDAPAERATGDAADFIAELVGNGFDVRSEESKPSVPTRRATWPVVPGEEARVLREMQVYGEPNVVNAMSRLQDARRDKSRRDAHRAHGRRLCRRRAVLGTQSALRQLELFAAGSVTS